jgi:predicted RNA-binding protein with PUA-like domain
METFPELARGKESWRARRHNVVVLSAAVQSCDRRMGTLDATSIHVLIYTQQARVAGTGSVVAQRVGVMNYWLVKSEPSAWSWDQQVAKGAKGEAWTGVRNFTARQNLVKMKKGDLAFFYHSNEGKEIVGIAEIIKEAYPDPSDKTGKFVCVDIKADKPLKTPVTMAAIKADKRLVEMALVKYSRLSVQPVTAEEWKIVCKMGGM